MIVLIYMLHIVLSKNKTKILQKQNIYLFCFVVLQPADKAGALPLDLWFGLGISMISRLTLT